MVLVVVVVEGWMVGVVVRDVRAVLFEVRAHERGRETV